MEPSHLSSSRAPGEATGFLFALLSALLYSTEGLAAKLLYTYGLTPIAVLLWRFLLAALIFVFLNRIRLFQSNVRPFPLIAAGLIQTFTVLFLFYAFALLPAGLAILLFYLYPAFVTAADVIFLKERLTAARLAGLLLTSTGLLIITGAPTGAFTFSGALYALLAALTNAAFVIFSSRFLDEIPVYTVSAWTTGTAALSFLFLALATGEFFLPDPSLQVYLLLAFLALVPTVFALVSLLTAVSRIGPARTAIIATLEPLFTAFLACLILGESLPPHQLLGGLLILLAALLQKR
jgi:drug/metabolite transporter (DMT)-like permease